MIAARLLLAQVRFASVLSLACSAQAGFALPQAGFALPQTGFALSQTGFALSQAGFASALSGLLLRLRRRM